MNIERIVIPTRIENKIDYKHDVKTNEVRQVLINSARTKKAFFANFYVNSKF
jgi:hypothetical protein